MTLKAKGAAPQDRADACPHCAADLRGTALPAEYLPYFTKGATHFSRKIGVEHPDLYDGVLYWRCPDCGGAWQRYTAGSPLYASAARCIAAANAERDARLPPAEPRR